MNTSQKTASTPLPLSPEEAQLASKLFGRSLFSALALAREQDMRRNLNDPTISADDEKTLRIPLPSNLLPSKTAAFGEPAYVSPDDPREPLEGQGVMAHIKRNLGKYLGSYGGAAIGGALGSRGKGISRLLNTVGGGVAGAGLGGGAGLVYDELQKDQKMNEMQNSAQNKKRILRGLLESGELEELLNSGEMNKLSSDSDDTSYEPGIFARAFKMQNNPMRMIFGGQTGFRDAKKEYYMRQKQNIQQELADAQRDYVDVLSKIKTGASNETPCVDAFCNGIVYSTLFGKTASAEDVEIEDGSVKRMLGDMLGTAKKPFQPAIDTAASGLLGTGAGSAYLTYLLRKKMREQPEAYMQDHLPTRVELQPYDV
jgi:hypothetical protein